MAKAEEYVVIPGTQQRLYEGSVVMLNRLPDLRWMIHYGYYSYSGKKQKGWYFSSVPGDTTMPVFNEDLLAMEIIDEPNEMYQSEPDYSSERYEYPRPYPPRPYPPTPYPPGPYPPRPYLPGPYPPYPYPPRPIPFTLRDKVQIDSSLVTVDTLAERNRLAMWGIQHGRIVRVNNIDGKGTLEYYSWNAATSSWDEASFGPRYMTRAEVMEEIDRLNTTIAELQQTLEERISLAEDRITCVEDRIDFGSGEDGILLVTLNDKLQRSNYKIGGDVLDPESTDKLIATEKAVTEAVSWHIL